MPLSDFDEAMQASILDDLADVFPAGISMDTFWDAFESAEDAFRFNASYLTGSGQAVIFEEDGGGEFLRITAKGIDYLRARTG